MNKFSKLGLSEPLTQVLENLGYEQPTEIQIQAIPLLLGHEPVDFIGLAQTGTGKTAAYGLPLLQLVDTGLTSPQALILAPTRELGQQIAKHLVEFSANSHKINVEVVYGGAPINNQIKALKKPTHVVVATPGRLYDLIKRKAVNLSGIKYLVLDEADEMLNMGFKESIDEILEYIPQDRAIWLFSATMPAGIRRIVKHYMDSPVEVSVNSAERVNKDIEHQYVTTKTSNKIPALRRFLDMNSDMRGIMFCRTKRETQQIADDLGNQGYGVEALHGDLSQSQRDAVMKRFKSRAMQLLIATDVAARGIDVNNLTHVFHHTLPDQLEGYTHRSGRTARAGKKGISLAFINPREGRRIKELEQKNRITFEPVEVPGIEDLTSRRMHNWAHLIINTKVDGQADNILLELQGTFKNLTKDDLLKRLITSQLDHILARNKGESNLNEPLGGNGRVKAEKGKPGRSKAEKNGVHRYFVNIGAIDGVTRGDLIHFLSDVSHVDRQHFSQVAMQKNYSFFYLDKQQDRGFADRFKGLDIDGHVIRVNRDDQENKPKVKSGKKHKAKARGGAGKHRRKRQR